MVIGAKTADRADPVDDRQLLASAGFFISGNIAGKIVRTNDLAAGASGRIGKTRLVFAIARFAFAIFGRIGNIGGIAKKIFSLIADRSLSFASRSVRPAVARLPCFARRLASAAQIAIPAVAAAFGIIGHASIRAVAAFDRMADAIAAALRTGGAILDRSASSERSA